MPKNRRFPAKEKVYDFNSPFFWAIMAFWLVGAFAVAISEFGFGIALGVVAFMILVIFGIRFLVNRAPIKFHWWIYVGASGLYLLGQMLGWF